jgi:glycerophosphoryl diester phosphodiesterase
MSWRSLWCCAVVLAGMIDLPATGQEPTPAQKLIASPGVLVIAHRGNSSVAPENTIPAFESAIDAKSDLVELDYHHAADGVPVVLHDEILDRTTDAEQLFGKPKLIVGDFASSELGKLDVGSWFDNQFVGVRLPTLLDSLKVIQARSTTLIERKAGDAQTLVRLLEEHKLMDTVVVQAFDWQFVSECRKLAPRLALGTLSGKPASDEQIRAAAATGADLIVWNHEKIGPEQIALIHQLGKKAWAYTIDDPQRARQLLSYGLDGIITNRPSTMVALRDVKGK